MCISELLNMRSAERGEKKSDLGNRTNRKIFADGPERLEAMIDD